VGLCFVLLAGSGLFVRSLRNALGSDLGFEAEGVALGAFDLSILGYEGREPLSFAEALHTQALSLPSVESAALATVVPIAGGAFSGTFATIDGYQPGRDEEIRIDRVFITPGYFETLGVPLLSGRDFGPGDVEGSTMVAIVSRSMAERYWPGDHVPGRVFRILAGPNGETMAFEVLGVAGDVHWRAVEEEATNFAYFPSAQHPDRLPYLTVLARTSADPGALLPLLRESAEGLERDLTFQRLSTMDDEIGQLLMPQRVGSVFLSGFAVLAVLLAGVGIFGLVSFTVREQRRAIGVRLAVGASRRKVVGEVMLAMAPPVVAGLALGLLGGFLLDDALGRFLYGVLPGDPLTYATIGVALLAAATVSTLLPARQAARVDPVRALRAD
jgi:predicted permease